ncbi:CYRIA/CYRIB Rac1 binding domain-containing protein [Entamoeba marina]
MGQILALFRGGASGEQITIDFENVNPTDAEMEVWKSVDIMLQKKDNVLEKITNYRGKDELIRKAISQRTEQTFDASQLSAAEEEAWKAISVQADTINEFYQFAVALETEFPKLVRELSNTDAKNSLTDKQALCKQLGLVLDFVLAFDNKKVTNPGIQNDFSYYRRSFQRMKHHKREGELRIDDEVANRISLFIANPSPMMSHLVTVINGIQNKALNPNLSEILTLLANVCNDMISKAIFVNNETNLFCLRVMTGCIILNDHISEAGSFHKKSPINIKDCIMQLKNFGDNEEFAESTNSLLDTIRYTCVHVGDPETPGFIKALLI